MIDDCVVPLSDGERAFLARVARRIAARRVACGLTQEQLAQLLDTVARNVQRIESGKQNLTLQTVARIASVLGVDPETLLGATGSQM